MSYGYVRIAFHLWVKIGKIMVLTKKIATSTACYDAGDQRTLYTPGFSTV